jgi:antitoxin ParD1/3/4
MNVTLTPRLEALVAERVKSGFYEDASEVVREGLRFLFEPGPRRARPSYAVASRGELESKLLEGGRRIPGKTAFKELTARAKARRHG